MTVDWPLVGRTEELAFIAAACDRAGAGVVIAGRAGVGKTRLARAGADAARRRGIRTVGVVGTATARGISFGAFGALAAPDGPEHQLTGAGSLAAHIRARLLDGGGVGDTLLVVDDAHLLDEHSATLVNQIALSCAAKLLLTVRSGEPCPDAVIAIWKDGALPRLDVQTLSRSETTALAEAALGGQLDASAAERLFELSQGNALYLRQLIEGELDSGRLAPRHDVWRWTGTPQLSQSLDELVSDRIGDQPAPVREVLEVLAIAEPLSLSTLRSVLLESKADPADPVERAERSGLIVLDAALEVRAGHPLFAEVSRARLGRVRARRLRAAVVRALADASATDATSVLRRASLMLDAEMPPDPHLLTEAAELAALRNDSALVQRLAQAAVDAGGGYRAQKVLAFFAAWTGDDPSIVDEAFARLEELATTTADRARAVVLRASQLAMVAAQPDAAIAMLDSRDESVRRAPEVLAFAALLDVEACRIDAADRAREVIRLVDREAHTEAATPEAVVIASLALVTALASAGRLAESEEAALRGIEAAAQTVELSSLGIAIAATQVHGLCIAGRLSEASELARSWHAQLAEHEPGSFFGDCMLGEVLLCQGAVSEAVRVLREARAGLEPYGDMGGWRYVALVLLTRAVAIAGPFDAAAATREDLRAHVHPTLLAYEVEQRLAEASVVAAEGRLSDAQALAVAVCDLAERRGQRGQAVVALQHAVSYGRAGLAERAADLQERVDGPRAPAVRDYAAAADRADGAALLDAARTFERLGDILAAGDAATLAAEAFDRAGLTGSALTARAFAERTIAATGGIRTAVMSRALSPLPLTAREREIVALAAHGLSNQAIADRLVVSVRTVEGHLYRINQKLGTTHRDELSRFV